MEAPLQKVSTILTTAFILFFLACMAGIQNSKGVGEGEGKMSSMIALCASHFPSSFPLNGYFQAILFWSVPKSVDFIFGFCTGIGQGRLTTNLKGAPIDDAVFVTDKEAVEMVRQSFICWYDEHVSSPYSADTLLKQGRKKIWNPVGQ